MSNKTQENSAPKIIGSKSVISFQIVFFIFLILITIFLAIFSYIKLSRESTEYIISKKRSLAFLSANIVHERLASIVNLGVSLATMPELVDKIEEGEWEAGVSKLAYVFDKFPFIERIFLFDPYCNIKASLPFLPEVIGESRAYRDWYKGVSSKWEPYVSGIFQRGSKPTINVVSVLIPIKSRFLLALTSSISPGYEKDVIGILQLQIKLNIFADWAKEFKSEQGEFVYTVDQYGRIVFHPKFDPLNKIIDFSTVPIVKELLNKKSGVEINYNPIEKEKRFAAYAPVPEYGWGVVVTQPLKAAFASRNRDLLLILSIYGIVILLSATIIYLSLHSFIKVEKAEKNLEIERIKMDTAFSGMSEGLIMIDHDNRIVLINSAARNMLMIGKQDPLYITMDSLPSIFSNLSAEINSEKRLLSKEIILGKSAMRIDAAPAKDANGSIVGTVVILRDITKDKEMDRLKSEFISSVSHELRTPLTTIRESVSQVLDKILGPVTEQQTEFLSFCLEDIDRLTRLINDLLDISKFESKKTEINKEVLDMVSLIKSVVASFAPMITAKGLDIRTSFSGDKIEISADRDKLIQVFTNLIGNSLKFTERGHIEISAIERTDAVECYVRDTGRGISDADLPKVFSKFQQFSRIDGPGEKGTGLGLAISKSIIELHQGRIWVESKLNEWSKFSFIIPIHNPVE